MSAWYMAITLGFSAVFVLLAYSTATTCPCEQCRAVARWCYLSAAICAAPAVVGLFVTAVAG